jgi:hypothetical protein
MQNEMKQATAAARGRATRVESQFIRRRYASVCYRKPDLGRISASILAQIDVAATGAHAKVLSKP